MVLSSLEESSLKKGSVTLMHSGFMDRRAFLKVATSAAATVLTARISVAGQKRLRRRPNFVFFLVDDLGWKDLGCFGSTFYETPNVDRLAATGIRFTSAYAACPVCSPTRASIMTGKYPARLRTTDFIGAPQPDAILKRGARNRPL